MSKRKFLISGLVVAGIVPSSSTEAFTNPGVDTSGSDRDEDQLLKRFAQEHRFSLAQHRSHQSHSSHSSHRSGASQRVRPAPPPRVPPAPRATPTPSPAPAPSSNRNQESTPPSSILPSSPETAPQTLLSPNAKSTEPSAPQIRIVIMQVQISLVAAGYYGGEIDGIVGPMTRSALTQYQRDRGLAVTGTITPEVLDAFGLSLE